MFTLPKINLGILSLPLQTPDRLRSGRLSRTDTLRQTKYKLIVSSAANSVHLRDELFHLSMTAYIPNDAGSLNPILPFCS